MEQKEGGKLSCWISALAIVGLLIGAFMLAYRYCGCVRRFCRDLESRFRLKEEDPFTIDLVEEL